MPFNLLAILIQSRFWGSFWFRWGLNFDLYHLSHLTKSIKMKYHMSLFLFTNFKLSPLTPWEIKNLNWLTYWGRLTYLRKFSINNKVKLGRCKLHVNFLVSPNPIIWMYHMTNVLLKFCIHLLPSHELIKTIPHYKEDCCKVFSYLN